MNFIHYQNSVIASFLSRTKQSFMLLVKVTLKDESRVERPVEPGTSRLRSPPEQSSGFPLAQSLGDPDVDSKNIDYFRENLKRLLC